MTEETAQAVMIALRAGRTLNSICSKRCSNGEWIEYRSRFEAYCAQNAEYAAQAGELQVENTKAANARKGRPVTFCKRGHLMAGDNLAFKRDIKDGKLYRYCRACHRFRSDRGGVMKPELVRKVREAVIAGLNIQQITRLAQGRKCLVCFAILRRYRIEHPEFDRFIIENARDRRSAACLRDFKIVPANAQFHFAAPAIIKPIRKELPPYCIRTATLNGSHLSSREDFRGETMSSRTRSLIFVRARSAGMSCQRA